MAISQKIAKITWLSKRGDELGIHVLYKGKWYDGYLKPAKLLRG